MGPSLYETTQSEPFTQPLWLIASPRLTMAAAARGLEKPLGTHGEDDPGNVEHSHPLKIMNDFHHGWILNWKSGEKK